MRVGKLSNTILLLCCVRECHRLACVCRRCWCAGGGLSGRCVRSVVLLLLLLLARHPRSGDCCAGKGRKERKGKRGALVLKGRSGWALRHSEQRQHVGLCHFTSPGYERLGPRGKTAAWTRTRAGVQYDSKPSLS